MTAVVALLNGWSARAAEQLRRASTSALLLLAAAVLILVAAVLALVAFYLWLSTFWPAYISVLVTAAPPLLIAAILIIRVKTVESRVKTDARAATAETDVSGAAEQAGITAARETLSEMQANPAGVLAGALVVGLIAGLLGPTSRS